MEVKYFVGSLSFTTQDQGLSDLFSQYGQVLSSHVSMDSMTGKSKGFGFVTMSHPIADVSLINSFELDGRNIYVDETRPLGKRENRKGGFDRDLRDVVEKIEIGFTLVDDKIKIVELFEDGNYKYSDQKNHIHNIFHTVYSDSIKLKESIQEFEYLINLPTAKEADLQKFFELNPNFILGEDYKKAHPKVILQREDSNILIPDFILEPYNANCLSDLLEIKLPKVNLYTYKKNRPKYSASIFEACAQLREYSAFFDDTANRNIINKKFKLDIYKPKMIVIIGRNKDIEPTLIKRVQSDLPGLNLMTYDYILEKMKRKKL